MPTHPVFIHCAISIKSINQLKATFLTNQLAASTNCQLVAYKYKINTIVYKLAACPNVIIIRYINIKYKFFAHWSEYPLNSCLLMPIGLTIV